MNLMGPCVYCNLKVGNTFLILSYSKAKKQKCFRGMRFHIVTLFSFNFLLHFLKSSLAMYYVAFTFLPAWRAL